MNKRTLIVVGVIALVVVGSVSVFIFRGSIGNFTGNEQASTGPTGCNDLTLKYVRQSLVYPYDIEKLSKANDAIMQEEEYKNNASCLYVLTSYDIQAGSLQNARKHMDQLLSVYDENEGFNDALTGYVLDPEILNKQLKLREDSVKAINLEEPDGFASEYDEPPLENQ